MKKPVRKPNRLQDYNYNQNGAYFVTICSKKRAEVFSHIVGAVGNRPPYIELADMGHIIENEIKIMQEIRNDVKVIRYVIMPNHIHMIIVIDVCGRYGDKGAFKNYW